MEPSRANHSYWGFVQDAAHLIPARREAFEAFAASETIPSCRVPHPSNLHAQMMGSVLLVLAVLGRPRETKGALRAQGAMRNRKRGWRFFFGLEALAPAS